MQLLWLSGQHVTMEWHDTQPRHLGKSDEALECVLPDLPAAIFVNVDVGPHGVVALLKKLDNCISACGPTNSDNKT